MEKDINPITTQPTLFNSAQNVLLLGPHKSSAVCPFCNVLVQTSIQYNTTSRTHIAAALCLTCCCCCVPYCSDSAKDTVHYCPKCQNYLGCYKK